MSTKPGQVLLADTGDNHLSAQRRGKNAVVKAPTPTGGRQCLQIGLLVMPGMKMVARKVWGITEKVPLIETVLRTWLA